MTACGKMQLIKRDCVHLLPTDRYKPERMARAETKKKKITREPGSWTSMRDEAGQH